MDSCHYKFNNLKKFLLFVKLVKCHRIFLKLKPCHSIIFFINTFVNTQHPLPSSTSSPLSPSLLFILSLSAMASMATSAAHLSLSLFPLQLHHTTSSSAAYKPCEQLVMITRESRPPLVYLTNFFDEQKLRVVFLVFLLYFRRTSVMLYFR